MEFLTNKNFDQKVLHNEKPVLVEIMTSSCPNCAAFDPIYKATEQANAEKADFFQLNAEDYLSIAKRYKVFGVPTLLYFRHGILIKKTSGIQSQEKMEKSISLIIGFSPEEAAAHEHKSLIQKLFGK